MSTLQARILWLHSPNLRHLRRSKNLCAVRKKKHVAVRQHKLWAAENKPAAERKRGKNLSKITKFSIELDNIALRNILVNYRSCKVSFRHDGHLVHAAFVAEDGVAEWAAQNCPVGTQVQDAIRYFANDLE